MYKHKVLILGGSTEGFLLAEKINQIYQGTVETMTSFAGITKKRRKVIGKSRVGGFGGVSGLADFLSAEKISVVIDATHPFAAQMKQNLQAAANKLEDVQYCHIIRPVWQAQKGDQWLMAGDIAQAAHCLNGFAREQKVFLAVGRKELAAFTQWHQIKFLARVIDPPEAEKLPPQIEFIVDRGPFDLEAERRLFERYDPFALVCKNSGGDAASAKLQVARERNIPVVMVQRPFLEVPNPAQGAQVQSVDAALAWLEHKLK